MVASKVLEAKRALVKILLALAVAYSVILKVNRDTSDADSARWLTSSASGASSRAKRHRPRARTSPGASGRHARAWCRAAGSPSRAERCSASLGRGDPKTAPSVGRDDLKMPHQCYDSFWFLLAIDIYYEMCWNPSPPRILAQFFLSSGSAE
jgi:hypothetical protein